MKLSASLKKLNYDLRQNALKSLMYHYERVVVGEYLMLPTDLVLLPSDDGINDQTIGELSISDGELEGVVFQSGNEIGTAAIKELSTDQLITLLEIMEEITEVPHGS